MAQTVKRLSINVGRPGFDPWVGKIPWRRKWQPTPVLLPRISHGQRSLGQATVHGVAESGRRRAAWEYPFTWRESTCSITLTIVSSKWRP